MPEPNAVEIIDRMVEAFYSINAARNYHFTVRAVDRYVCAANEVPLFTDQGSPNTPWVGVTRTGTIKPRPEPGYRHCMTMPFRVVAAVATDFSSDVTERWREVAAARLEEDLWDALFGTALLIRRTDTLNQHWAIGTNVLGSTAEVGFKVSETGESRLCIAFAEIDGECWFNYEPRSH